MVILLELLECNSSIRVRIFKLRNAYAVFELISENYKMRLQFLVHKI